MNSDLKKKIWNQFKLKVIDVQALPSLKKAMKYAKDRYDTMFAPNQVIFSSRPVPRWGGGEDGGWVWTIETQDAWGDLPVVLKMMDWRGQFHPSLKAGFERDLTKFAIQHNWNRFCIYTHISRVIEAHSYETYSGLNLYGFVYLNQKYFGWCDSPSSIADFASATCFEQLHLIGPRDE